MMGLDRPCKSPVTAPAHLPMRRSVFNPVGLYGDFSLLLTYPLPVLRLEQYRMNVCDG